MDAPKELRQEHQLQIEETYECAYCGRTFSEREEAAMHLPKCRKHPAAKYVQVYDTLIEEIEAILKAAPTNHWAVAAKIRNAIGNSNERLGRPRC